MYASIRHNIGMKTCKYLQKFLNLFWSFYQIYFQPSIFIVKILIEIENFVWFHFYYQRIRINIDQT